MRSFEFNMLQLETVATALNILLSQVTFVGGCTTALFVDETAHSGVRQTEDVDFIVDVVTTADYYKFEKELRKLGFREDIKGPICRWLLDSNSLTIKLDVMPTDETILGFSNRWYELAIQESEEITLPSGLKIRVVSPTYFIATKFEAFAGRGKGDYFSRDIEDIIFVMEHRQNLLLELIDSHEELKKYFSDQAEMILNDQFLNVLPGLLDNPDSAKFIENSFKIMASWE